MRDLKFKGLVNGVEYNSTEEYQEALQEAIKNGTLTSTATAVTLEDVEEENNKNEFSLETLKELIPHCNLTTKDSTNELYGVFKTILREAYDCNADVRNQCVEYCQEKLKEYKDIANNLLDEQNNVNRYVDFYEHLSKGIKNNKYAKGDEPADDNPHPQKPVANDSDELEETIRRTAAAIRKFFGTF